MNKITPKYLKILIKQYPKITSGRKNYEFFEKRILKNLDLIKKYRKTKITKLFQIKYIYTLSYIV